MRSCFFVDVELGVDALRMHAHGVLGDHQLLGDAHHGLAAHDVLHDLGFSCAQAELLADAGRLLGDAVLVNRLASACLRAGRTVPSRFAEPSGVGPSDTSSTSGTDRCAPRKALWKPPWPKST